MGTYRATRILVVVKTYPIPSQKYGETVCCAGVDLDTGAWVRMYPITFRRLAARFKKYEIVDCRAAIPRDDQRPESRRVDQDSIHIAGRVSSTGNWRRRLDLLPPTASSLEELKTGNRNSGISIGSFRPKAIRKLVIEAGRPWSDKQLRALRQQRMKLGEDDSAELRELEQLPFKFSYQFQCDDDACNGHKLQILDWEIGEAYRKWSRRYPTDWRDRLEAKFANELPAKDLILVVGTMAAHPKDFVIIGLVYPPRSKVSGFGVQEKLNLMGEQGAVAGRRILFETKKADALGFDERQQTLDLIAGVGESVAVSRDEGIPVGDDGAERPRGAERRQG